MLIKASSFLYLFDWDGTICGSNDFLSLFDSYRACLKKLYVNPSKWDIRWSIMTSRPKMDIPFIKYCCWKYGLKPQELLTTPTFRWQYESLEEAYQWKVDTIKAILDGTKKLKYPAKKIPEKICYIDNDPDTIRFMNGQRTGYAYITVSVIDFVKSDFPSLI